MGRSNRAFFRLSAIDSRSPRDGRVIEELGHYDPRAQDQAKQFVAKIDRCKHWLDVGAIPSETVSTLLKRSGLEHKQLRLPKPGKPKAPPAAGPAKEGAKAKEAKPEGAEPEKADKTSAAKSDAPAAEATPQKSEPKEPASA
jgi:small subunit ribosomal protein S16